MSDIYPITLTRYNDLDEAGLIDTNQIYQIYDTDEDIAKELIHTRKALDVAVDALKKIGFGCGIPPDENYAYNYINIAADAYQQIQTLLEQKDVK